LTHVFQGSCLISTQNSRELLAIVELGGYPDFSPLYRQHGYQVKTTDSVRKAAKLIKKRPPQVIVTEFNFQSDFRDRTSSLETLMAIVQRLPDTRVIVFYEKEFLHQFERVTQRFPIHAALPFPIEQVDLENALQQLDVSPG
jgi:DNA-binding NtrC family response regulator